MQDLTYIRNELVLEAHLDADEPHILLRREGELGAVRAVLGDVRYLISALGSMAAGRPGGWWAILGMMNKSCWEGEGYCGQ